MRAWGVWIGVWIGVGIVAGCGPRTTGARPDGPRRAGRGATTYLFEFPSEADLERLVSGAPATLPAPERGTPLSRWELTPPADETTYAAASVVEPMVIESGAAAGVELVPTPAGRCAADQLARYELERIAAGDETLSVPAELARHALGRCGTITAQHALWAHAVTGPADATDEEVLGVLGTSVRDGITRMFSGGVTGRFELGAVVRHLGRNHVVTAVLSRAPTTFAAPSEIDATGHVTLHLTADRLVDHVFALINQGALGYARCAAVPYDTAIAIRCPMASEDGSTWVSVFGARATSTLLDALGETIVARDPAAGWVYELAAPPSATGATPREAILATVNAYRSAAGLPALVLSTAHSDLADALAPRFFDARAPAGEREVATLGILSALRVETSLLPNGHVIDGNLVGEQVLGGDPATWAASSIGRPLGRMVLLSPDASVLALGILPGTGLTSAIAATYGGSRTGEAARVLDAIDQMRALRGLTPVRRLVPSASLVQMATAIDGGTDPNAALDRFGPGIEREMPPGTRAMIQTISAVDPGAVWMALDEATLLRPELSIAIATARWAPEGMRWAQLEALLVVYE